MTEVKEIASADQIPGGAKWALVMLGDENATSAHSRGFTVTINRHQPDELRDSAFSSAIQGSKKRAEEEGIAVLYVLR